MSKNAKRRKLQKTDSYTYWVPIALLLAVGIVSYWNSFDAPLVFDDFLSIQKNAGVRLGEYFTIFSLSARSLLYMTFALNYYFHATDVWGYHLVNFLLHLVNGILTFFIAKHIFSKRISDERTAGAYALFAAACFLAHPLQTESVTYISSRSELVSVCFYALAFLLFITRPVDKIGFWFSWVIILIFLAALGGKETAITLPAVLVLYDWLFLSERSWKGVLSKWRFYVVFLAGAFYAGYRITITLLQGAIGANQEGHLGYWQYFLSQTEVIVRYMRLLLLPYGQSLDHAVRIPVSALDFRVIGSVLLILGVIYLGWHFRKTQPIVTFAIFWFFITLSPTSSFVPILDLMFEHRLYMPMVGLCLVFPLMVTSAMHYLNGKLAIRVPVSRAFTALVLILITLTVLRNEIWRDETTLWADAIAKSPGRVRPYNLLSMAYFKRGEFEKAAEVGERAIRENPEIDFEFRELLGNTYVKLGRYDKAVESFMKSAEVHNIAGAYNNVGVTYLYMWEDLKQRKASLSEDEFQKQKTEILNNASRAFLKSLELDPDFLWGLDAYVNVHFDLGDTDTLRRTAETKLNEGEHFDSLYILAKLLFNEGRFPDALPYFERAAVVVPQDESYKLFFYNWGFVLNRAGNLDRAIEAYKTALSLDPVFIEAYHNLGLVYVAKNDFAAAEEAFTEALRTDPNHILTHLEIAKIYMRQSKTRQAKEHVQFVLSRQPGNALALQLMQMIGS